MVQPDRLGEISLPDPSAKIAQDLLDTTPKTTFRADLADSLVFNDPRIVRSARIAHGREVRILVLTNPLVCVDNQGSNSLFDLSKAGTISLRYRDVFSDHGSFTIAHTLNGALINAANRLNATDIREWTTYQKGKAEETAGPWGRIFDVEFEIAALNELPLLINEFNLNTLPEIMERRGLRFNMAGFGIPNRTSATRMAAMANVPLLSP